MKQKPWGNAACCFHPTPHYSYLASSYCPGYLPRDADTHSELGSPPSMNNQGISPLSQLQIMPIGQPDLGNPSTEIPVLGDFRLYQDDNLRLTRVTILIVIKCFRHAITKLGCLLSLRFTPGCYLEAIQGCAAPSFLTYFLRSLL